MTDRSWMLNADAIRAARKCVSIVKEELDVKLLLSHPDFMQLLHEYVEMTESRQLSDAYAHLLAYTGVGGTVKQLRSKASNVEEIRKVSGSDVVSSEPEQSDTVLYGGRKYPRYQEGREFSGVYRGQPYYQ